MRDSGHSGIFDLSRELRIGAVARLCAASRDLCRKHPYRSGDVSRAIDAVEVALASITSTSVFFRFE